MWGRLALRCLAACFAVGGAALPAHKRSAADAVCRDIHAAARRTLSLRKLQRHLTFAYAPIVHPLLHPFCLAPVTQGLEQAGLTYLPPNVRKQHVGASGRVLDVPTSWRTEEASVVLQYYRLPGDREGGRGITEATKKMDALHKPDGTRLVWGIENATHVGGHKQIQYRALRRFANSRGCSVNQLDVMPETYLLADHGECTQFFAKYPPGDHSQDAVWFVKDGSKHGSRGVTVVANSSAVHQLFGACPRPGEALTPPPPEPQRTSTGKQVWVDPRNTVDQLGGLNRATVLVQREVPPLLVGGKRFSIRAYMVVARADPLLVAWAVNASYVGVSHAHYSAGQTNKLAQVTSAWRTEAAGGGDGAGGWDAGSKAETWQSLTWLEAQLGAPGLVEQVLQPQILALFQTLVGAAELGRALGGFGILGIDLMLTPDYELVFMEGNMANGWIGATKDSDKRCETENGAPWLEVRNQQMISDTMRLVKLLHTATDPSAHFEQLEQGRYFQLGPCSDADHATDTHPHGRHNHAACTEPPEHGGKSTAFQSSEATKKAAAAADDARSRLYFRGGEEAPPGADPHGFGAAAGDGSDGPEREVFVVAFNEMHAAGCMERPPPGPTHEYQSHKHPPPQPSGHSSSSRHRPLAGVSNPCEVFRKGKRRGVYSHWSLYRAWQQVSGAQGVGVLFGLFVCWQMCGRRLKRCGTKLVTGSGPAKNALA